MNTYNSMNMGQMGSMGGQMRSMGGQMTMAPMGTMMGTMNGGFAPMGMPPRRRKNNNAMIALVLLAVLGGVGYLLYTQMTKTDSPKDAPAQQGQGTDAPPADGNDGSGNTGGNTGGDSGSGGDAGNGGSTGGNTGNGGSTGNGGNTNPEIPSSVPTSKPFSRDDVIARAKYWVSAAPSAVKTGSNNPRFHNYRVDVSGMVGWAYDLKGENDGPTTKSLLSTHATKISKDELLPGDIMLVNGYCVIFVRWTNSSKTKYEMMYVSESAKTPVKREYPYPFYMIGSKPEYNLQPYRLKVFGTGSGGSSTGGGSTPTPTGSGPFTGAEAVARAKTWVDAAPSSVKVNGNTPRYNGYRVDVSGMVGYAYDINVGNDGPNTTTLLSSYTTKISKNELQPGDIMLVKGYCTIFVRWVNSAKTKYECYYVSENNKKPIAREYPYPFYMVNGKPEHALQPYRINSTYRK